MSGVPAPALVRFLVVDAAGRPVASAAVPRVRRGFSSPLHRSRAIAPGTGDGEDGAWPARFAALSSGRTPAAWGASRAEAESLRDALVALRRRGFATEIGLGSDGAVRAAAAVAGRVTAWVDPAALVADWCAWLRAGSAWRPGDAEGLDAALEDLTSRRPSFGDWLPALPALAPLEAPGGEPGALRRALVATVVRGEDPVVRAAHRLALRTGDRRYWSPAPSASASARHGAMSHQRTAAPEVEGSTQA